jgi:hypothetical protein
MYIFFLYEHDVSRFFYFVCLFVHVDLNIHELIFVYSINKRPQQSQDLEIQERANTLRRILSEWNILSLHWEESTEEVSKERASDTAAVGPHTRGGGVLNEKEKEMMDLLELPMFTQSSVRSVDEAGAKRAVEKQAVLRALVAEEFYAVHSKAQRKVPVPEELDLDAVLNESALDKLLAVDIPDKLTLSGLSLIYTPSGDHPSQHPYANHPGGSLSAFGGGQGSGYGYGHGHGSGDLSVHLSRQFGDAVSLGQSQSQSQGAYTSAAGDQSTVASGSAYSSSSAAAAAAAGAGGSRPADDVFMLSSGAHAKAYPSIIPLSKILGDTFEDDDGDGGDDDEQVGGRRRSHKGHRRDKDRGKGRDRRHSSSGAGKSQQSRAVAAEINKIEMVPAGAVSFSDDEGDDAEGGKNRKGPQQQQQQQQRGRRQKQQHSGGNSSEDDENVIKTLDCAFVLIVVVIFCACVICVCFIWRPNQFRWTSAAWISQLLCERTNTCASKPTAPCSSSSSSRMVMVGTPPCGGTCQVTEAVEVTKPGGRRTKRRRNISLPKRAKKTSITTPRRKRKTSTTSLHPVDTGTGTRTETVRGSCLRTVHCWAMTRLGIFSMMTMCWVVLLPSSNSSSSPNPNPSRSPSRSPSPSSEHPWTICWPWTGQQVQLRPLLRHLRLSEPPLV